MAAPTDPTARSAADDRLDGAPNAGPSLTDRAGGSTDSWSDGGFTTLSPKVLLLWRFFWGAIGAAITAIAVIIGAASVDLPVAARVAIPVVVAAIAIALVAAVPAAAYDRWRYRVTDDGLDLQHGLVVHHQSSIPHFRVQHVDIRRGLIQRQLGIVSLTISTASPATDAQLPGLDPEQAEGIRRRVLDRAEADDGV